MMPTTLKSDLFSKYQEWKGRTIRCVDHCGGDGGGRTALEVEVGFSAAREEEETTRAARMRNVLLLC